MESQYRIGLGNDTHRLVTGRQLVLGSVAVEHTHGLVGHSDADVLLHAIIDALLGAAGLGDIGEWFPDTDERWSGADSTIMLAAVAKEIDGRNWRIVNLDCTIFAERPKLAPWKPSIRRRLAELLGMKERDVNVKAKSGERVGPVGRGESVSSNAIVLLQSKSK